jgi:hypothetical protein
MSTKPNDDIVFSFLFRVQMRQLLYYGRLAITVDTFLSDRAIAFRIFNGKQTMQFTYTVKQITDGRSLILEDIDRCINTLLK